MVTVSGVAGDSVRFSTHPPGVDDGIILGSRRNWKTQLRGLPPVRRFFGLGLRSRLKNTTAYDIQGKPTPLPWAEGHPGAHILDAHETIGFEVQGGRGRRAIYVDFNGGIQFSLHVFQKPPGLHNLTSNLDCWQLVVQIDARAPRSAGGEMTRVARVVYMEEIPVYLLISQIVGKLEHLVRLGRAVCGVAHTIHLGFETRLSSKIWSVSASVRIDFSRSCWKTREARSTRSGGMRVRTKKSQALFVGLFDTKFPRASRIGLRGKKGGGKVAVELHTTRVSQVTQSLTRTTWEWRTPAADVRSQNGARVRRGAGRFDPETWQASSAGQHDSVLAPNWHGEKATERQRRGVARTQSNPRSASRYWVETGTWQGRILPGRRKAETAGGQKNGKTAGEDAEEAIGSLRKGCKGTSSA
ncbi:hypothetical protein B0H16DRAFT_1475767 [Mycena metata]|uniref:Uncharacterized protein n=1 Tax=Mycena metata TaxID=1033252 RepID=A0AAD7MHT9_9AGAR|nr:hypothetical protein B0H16DRAFT_1475767 [Mycena metata]